MSKIRGFLLCFLFSVLIGQIIFLLEYETSQLFLLTAAFIIQQLVIDFSVDLLVVGFLIAVVCGFAVLLLLCLDAVLFLHLPPFCHDQSPFCTLAHRFSWKMRPVIVVGFWSGQCPPVNVVMLKLLKSWDKIWRRSTVLAY